MKARVQIQRDTTVLVMGVGFVGLILFLAALPFWKSKDPYHFGCIVLLAAASSGFRVALPGVSGVLSANFLFILYSIIEFSYSETMAMGVFLTLAQCLSIWKKPLTLEQIGFNVGLASIATAAAYGAAHTAVLNSPSLETSVRLFAAAMTLFIVHNVPTAYMISVADRRGFVKTWRECFVWSLPYYLLGAAAAGLGVIAGRNVGWQTALMVIPILYLVYRSYHMYLSQIEEEKRHTSEMASLHIRTIEALALAIEAKDGASQEHLHRVQVYCGGVAEEMGLPPEQIQALEAASLLHDIGKLAVPDHIISKQGALTPEEMERMKIHPVVGAEILGRVRFPYPVEPIVRCHHERWDGSGYPDRLSGDAIPIGARILSVVDAFDTAARRLEADGVRSPLEAAFQEVRRESGKAFDPKVVDALGKSYMALEARATEVSPARLRISEGAGNTQKCEPAAGFAAEGASSHEEGVNSDFLRSIAAARQEVQTLFELAQDLGNSLSLDETLAAFTQRLERIVPMDCLALYLLNGKRLTARHIGGGVRLSWVGASMLVGEGLSGWVAENRKAILNGNPAVEPGYSAEAGIPMRSALSVPLEGMTGAMGVLTLYHRDRDAFTRDHLRILLAISSKVALSVENALRFLQAENSATTDYLTGLPNARSLYLHLEAELARCDRTNQTCSVLVCDLDGFKQVNDRFGHLEGNRALKLVSAGMKEACREYDYVARMGGDEFVVVLPGIRPADVESKCARFEKVAVEVGVAIAGEKVLAMSIGAAHYPADGQDRETLLQCADERMYAEKRKNKKRMAESGQGVGWKSHAPPRTTAY